MNVSGNLVDDNDEECQQLYCWVNVSSLSNSPPLPCKHMLTYNRLHFVTICLGTLKVVKEKTTWPSNHFFAIPGHVHVNCKVGKRQTTTCLATTSLQSEGRLIRLVS